MDISVPSPLGQLGQFLDALEKDQDTRRFEQHYCVMPAEVTTDVAVGRYVWVAPEGVICSASYQIENGGKLYVSARNYGLHRYIVEFNIVPDNPAVTLESGTSSAKEFRGLLLLDMKPPIRRHGAAVCKGCTLLLAASADVTASLVCNFAVTHEGKTVSNRTRDVILAIRDISGG